MFWKISTKTHYSSGFLSSLVKNIINVSQLYVNRQPISIIIKVRSSEEWPSRPGDGPICGVKPRNNLHFWTKTTCKSLGWGWSNKVWTSKTSGGRLVSDQEIDPLSRSLSPVMRALLRLVVVNKELNLKAKIWIYWSVWVPAPTCSSGVWIMTQRSKSWILAAEIIFLHRVAGLGNMRGRGTSSFSKMLTKSYSIK